MDSEDTMTWCPSGRADAAESVVLGVHATPGQLTYLAAPIPARDALSLVPEDISPTRVLRFASHCVSGCGNREGSHCTLMDRVAALPAQADSASVPRCHLRPNCQWWRQSGVEACHRCPQVVTTVTVDDDLGNLVSNPRTTPEEVAVAVGSAATESGTD
ncbi:hypothetical protein GXW83_17085 [Streptacidiphilus sp. PB12-B1b]|uniref:hypothetical protein n=1 Tax=Streptacidiphilus sp. PB12-B1b TaxID=2705012 RepID=UPI0015FAE4F9|nr:hypothetical protein [Streptacidiphilus sp. PB12-B1b]QMU77166.1 hypothetical protein GXW83_17085 [Streptacidiphilus sp. PB12-B1b]